MSITLTQPVGVTITGPNPVSETDSIGACTNMNVDYFAQTVTFVFRTGTIVNSNLNAGVYGPTVTLVVNLTTGAWTAFNSLSGASSSGTIGAGALASFNSQLKSDRNLVETFAAGGGQLLPGTQVPWT